MTSSVGIDQHALIAQMEECIEGLDNAEQAIIQIISKMSEDLRFPWNSQG